MPHGEGGDANGPACREAPQRQSYRQRLIKPNRTLEDIAGNLSEGQDIGLRRNLTRVCEVVAGRFGLIRRRRRESIQEAVQNEGVRMDHPGQGNVQGHQQEVQEEVEAV